ncbi:MAG: AAA family ATPase [Eubacterium sp.]|nr:AAA family ATPase [Eubacterium sp.]
MYFKREIWKKLLFWKNEQKQVTLEVHGARQVGKTFILKKFCQSEFENFIYMNMAEKSGRDFLVSIAEMQEKYHKREVESFHVFDLLKGYDPAFEDSENTVVVIDEIQESAEVYNLIREFTRGLRARFIVTGSYLGKVLDKEFFLPVGDLATLTVHSLSFLEYLDIFGLKEVQAECYKQKKPDEAIKKHFEIYLRIGGYPAVIKKYLQTGSVSECRKVLTHIIDMFISESLRYFSEINDFDVFRDLMSAITILAAKEKQGTNLIEDVVNIVAKRGTNRLSKDTASKAIAWLRTSGIIGYATKLIDGDALSQVSHARFYFQDIGVAGFFMSSTGVNVSIQKGILAENYVYMVLRNQYYPGSLAEISQEVIGFEPMFSVYEKTGGELDFIVCGKFGGKKYGIEVKAGRNRANTGRVMLNSGLIDHLYLLEGVTSGGETDCTTTLPLYLADQLELQFHMEGQMELFFFS